MSLPEAGAHGPSRPTSKLPIQMQVTLLVILSPFQETHSRSVHRVKIARQLASMETRRTTALPAAAPPTSSPRKIFPSSLYNPGRAQTPAGVFIKIPHESPFSKGGRGARDSRFRGNDIRGGNDKIRGKAKTIAIEIPKNDPCVSKEFRIFSEGQDRLTRQSHTFPEDQNWQLQYPQKKNPRCSTSAV